MVKFCKNTIEFDFDFDCVIPSKSVIFWPINQSTPMNVRSAWLISRNAVQTASARVRDVDAASMDAKVQLFQYEFAKLFFILTQRSVRQRLT
jgi:hypothetical protein